MVLSLQVICNAGKQFADFKIGVFLCICQIKFLFGRQHQHPVIRVLTSAAPGMGEIYPFILCSQVQNCG